MADEKAALIFGKYKTQEDAEKGFKELEARLGQQGTELGEMKKLVGQWQPWIEKASPIVEWYGTNAAKVNDWVSKGMNTSQPANQNVAAAEVQARAAAANTAGYEWLTPQEKQGLVGDIRTAILKETLEPWTQSFTQQAQAFAGNLTNRFDQQHRSFTDVLWKTFERVLPKDKLEEVKAWHEASLRFADPSKIDPMKMGDEFVNLTGENASLKARVKEYEEKTLAAEKASVPNLFGSPSPDTVASPEPLAPTSRDERMKNVMTTVQAEHGQEGVKAMFPSLV